MPKQPKWKHPSNFKTLLNESHVGTARHCAKGYRVITFWSSSAEEMRIRCMVSRTCNSWLLRHRFPSASENIKSSFWARPQRGISYLVGHLPAPHHSRWKTRGRALQAQRPAPTPPLTLTPHIHPSVLCFSLSSSCILPNPKCPFWGSLTTLPERW